MEREKNKNLDDRFEKLRDNAFRLLQASQIESLKEIDPEALTNQDLEVFEKFLNQPLEETTEKEVEEYLKNMAGELKNQYGFDYAAKVKVEDMELE